MAARNTGEMQQHSGGPALTAAATERALLAALLARLRHIDPDVILGHNVAAFDLDVLLHRLQHHKVEQGWGMNGEPNLMH